MATTPKRKRTDRKKHLRGKRAKGAATESELAELVALEGGRAPTALATPIGADAAGAVVDPIPGEHEVASPPDPAAPAAQTAASVPPPIPEALPDPDPLPRPPKVDLGDMAADKPRAAGAQSAQSGDWRQKWRDKSQRFGREGTCVGLAMKGVEILEYIEKQNTDAGVAPLPFDLREEMLAPLVLTLDRILPERVALTPELTTVAGTVAVVSRRVINRKQIAAHQKDAAEKAKHAEFRRKQGERSSVVQGPWVKPDDPKPATAAAATAEDTVKMPPSAVPQATSPVAKPDSPPTPRTVASPIESPDVTVPRRGHEAIAGVEPRPMRSDGFDPADPSVVF